MSTMTASYLKSNFAPAFFFLPKENRQALRVIYAFFRLLDDVVDNGHSQPRAFLESWKMTVNERDTTHVGQWGCESLAQELLAVSKTYAIPAHVFTDFIDKGLAVDLSNQRFDTPLETEAYCYGVAGTVGIACLPIFGVPIEEGRNFAIRLGVAVQWVNMIRDAGADARINRIYFPSEHIHQFGLSESQFLSDQREDVFYPFFVHQANVARAHFKRAAELMPLKWQKELTPARIMGQIYSDLLLKLEKNRFPVFTKSVSLNIVEKAASVWRIIRKRT